VGPLNQIVQKNQLYYGDNLGVLREHIKDESVDLIYLDPPFNSRQDDDAGLDSESECRSRTRHSRRTGQAAKELSLSRQAVIKTLLHQALDRQYQSRGIQRSIKRR
jgi:16S rRNA G966 N2-methylase RsmD